MEAREPVGSHVPIQRLEVGCDGDPLSEVVAPVAGGEQSSEAFASGCAAIGRILGPGISGQVNST